MKKIISLMLAVVTALTMNVCATAEQENYIEDGITPYYLYTISARSRLSISSRKATCTSTLSGKSGVTKIVVTQRLRKKSGKWWIYVEEWSKTYYTNSFTFINTKSSLATGNTYDVELDANVYSGSSYEHVVAASDEISI